MLSVDALHLEELSRLFPWLLSGLRGEGRLLLRDSSQAPWVLLSGTEIDEEAVSCDSQEPSPAWV